MIDFFITLRFRIYREVIMLKIGDKVFLDYMSKKLEVSIDK